VALALVRARVEHKGFRLRVVPQPPCGSAPESKPVVYPIPRLLTLVDLLGNPPESAKSIVWGLAGGGWFEIGSCNPALMLPAPKTGRWSNAHSRAEALKAGAGTEKRW
jgi:hypothetical protein